MQWADDNEPDERERRFHQASHALLGYCRHLGARMLPFAKNSHRTSGDITEVASVNSAGTGRESGTWPDRLGEEKDFLIALVNGIETEFLATGGGLMQLAQQLNETREECESLTDLTLGRGDDAGVQFAFQLLKKAEDLVLASYDQYEHAFATFRELQQRLAQLSKRHDELMRVLLPLNVITISFRIEASRHPEDVRNSFLTLAASMNQTVTEVRSTMERQFEELAASERIARNLMAKASASIQQQRKDVTLTLETSRNHLRGMNAMLADSGSEIAGLAELNQAVTRHIGGIVMAQQCQDITRQRIEHIGEAMDEMRAHLDDALVTTSGSDTETRQFVFRAAQIQLHQAQNVFDQLNRAADELKSGIQNLRTDSRAGAEVALKLGAKSLGSDVARQCQASIGGILAIIQQAVRQITEILAAFVPLQTRFVDCTSRATGLAIDVRLAALNAQILAIQAPDGAALEVLSGHVRVISKDAIEQVGLMGTALHHTVETVNNLQQRLEDFQYMGRAEEELLTEESAISQQKLSALETSIPTLIRRITQQQRALAQSIEAVLAKVQLPATVAKASARSTSFFQEMVAWGSEGGSGFVLESEASRKIDLLKSKYTMDSEREAHAAAMLPVLVAAGAATPISSIDLFESFDDFEAPPTPAEDLLAGHPQPVAPPAPPAAKKPAPSEDLGDNVELF